MAVLATERELLAALSKRGGQLNRVRLSQAFKVGFEIPYIATLLAYLKKAGLVALADSRSFRITEKGRQFLKTV